MYLEQRRRQWYALHSVPPRLRQAVGKVRFVQCLQTEDKRIAERRAVPLEARWLLLIEQARKGTQGDPQEHEARYWQAILKDTPEHERPLVLDLIAQEAGGLVERAAERAGITDVRDPGFQQLPEQDAAQRFYDIATGKLLKLDEHLEEWLGTLANEAKSKDMKRATVKRFAAEFPYSQDVTRKKAQHWINSRTQEGNKPATIQRSLSELRGYWSYLQSIEAVSDEHLPFEKLTIPRASTKGNDKDERKPFEASDVVKLLAKAVAGGDAKVADLIRLGMWTGARIEELCALKVANVGDGFFDIVDAKSKAGQRRVPIHSKLKGTVTRLVKASGDGYVLSGLTENKYGDRSNAIGKRFGRLKTDAGFGKDYVFHSIRKTVATILENAGVAEGVVADIIGHDKPSLTYGLYSGGASLETKQKAIEILSY